MGGGVVGNTTDRVNSGFLPRKDIINGKEEGFCRAYLRIGIGGKAYQEFHPDASDNTAYVEASRMLDKPKIILRIDELRKRAAARSEISMGRVLNEYRKLAFLDIRKAFDSNGNLKDVTELDDDTAAAVAGIEFEDVFDGVGRDREKVGILRKVKLSDKKGALDSITKILGGFVDKSEHRLVDKNGNDRTLMGELDAMVEAATNAK